MLRAFRHEDDPKVFFGGALMIGIRIWGPLYCHYDKETPRNGIGNYWKPYIKALLGDFEL